MTKTIADMTIWPEPNRRATLAREALWSELTAAEEATGAVGPLAEITALAYEIRIYLIGERDYLVAQPAYGKMDVAYFISEEEPASQVYCRALLWATRQAAQALEDEGC